MFGILPRNPKVIIIVSILFLLICVIVIGYIIDIRNAYSRFKRFKPKQVATKYGEISFLDVGDKNPILIFHGICGGYDQGFINLEVVLNEEINNLRVISPSRFGYHGSSIPKYATPKKQAEAFNDLLEQLKIEKTFVFAVSAGGGPAIRFVLDYPQKVRGLILLSSGAPTEETPEKIKSPPFFLFHDFPMWLSLKMFKPVFMSMFGIDKAEYKNAPAEEKEVFDSLLETMLPISNRFKGIINDLKITNLDMMENFTQYEIEKINVPVLIIHAKDDPMASYENMVMMKNHLKNVKMITFEKGGHLIFGSGKEVRNAIINFTSTY